MLVVMLCTWAKNKTLFLTFESDQMFELKALFVHREVDDLNSSLEACETLAAIFSRVDSGKKFQSLNFFSVPRGGK